MSTNLSQLELIQNQLNALKSQQTQQQQMQTLPMQPFPNYSQSLQDMVSKEVNIALQRIVDAQQPQQQAPQAQLPAPTNPNDPNATLINTIDKFAQSILTKEQITWLMDPTILSGLPLFFKSEKGKQAVGLLFSEYQDYVNR